MTRGIWIENHHRLSCIEPNLTKLNKSERQVQKLEQSHCRSQGSNCVHLMCSRQLCSSAHITACWERDEMWPCHSECVDSALIQHDTRHPQSAPVSCFILSEALKIHKHCSGPQGRGRGERLALKLLTYSHGGFSEQCVILIVAFSDMVACQSEMESLWSWIWSKGQRRAACQKWCWHVQCDLLCSV